MARAQRQRPSTASCGQKLRVSGMSVRGLPPHLSEAAPVDYLVHPKVVGFLKRKYADLDQNDTPSQNHILTMLSTPKNPIRPNPQTPKPPQLTSGPRPPLGADLEGQWDHLPGADGQLAAVPPHQPAGSGQRRKEALGGGSLKPKLLS